MFSSAMPFWTYMLHCADRSFYVGHTDDLGTRITAHQSGAFGGYTSTRLPAELVWSEQFLTRVEALAMERRIKGWSRANKLALIRGDWERIQALARGKGPQRTESDSKSPQIC
ncbi:MAG: GIY-YIG nuclease family protein [Sphingomonadales bacterium]